MLTPAAGILVSLLMLFAARLCVSRRTSVAHRSISLPLSVEVVLGDGKVVGMLKEGDYFGEIAVSILSLCHPFVLSGMLCFHHP